MHTFIVYVIQNERGKIYIGYTTDLEKRLARHNRILPSRVTAHTSKQGRRWQTIYTESFKSRKEAISREKQLKSSRGRAYLRGLL